MEKLLNIEQLSELIQISRSTLYEWTHCGFIPHYKLPKGVRFKEAEVDNWLKRRQRKGRSQFRIKI
ncbi:MAG: helix-turn-helix transcriptional regulator [Mobilitalea sp.]